MSDLSEKIRVALFTKLNVSGVTIVATGGVHHMSVPETANKPFVVFQRQASADVRRAFGNNIIAEDDLWLIKAVSDEDSSTTKEPQALNAEILKSCETAIGSSLTIADGVVWEVVRMRDIPEFYEVANDRLIYHSGFLLRVVSSWGVRHGRENESES